MYEVSSQYLSFFFFKVFWNLIKEFRVVFEKNILTFLRRINNCYEMM